MQLEVGLKARAFLARCHRLACGLPGLETSVEHGHIAMSGPLQHPPQAPAVVGAVAVIDHGLHVVGKTDLRQPHGKQLAAGQRVAAARGGLLAGRHAAMCAGHAVFCAEVMVQVGEDGAGNMRLQVLRLAGRGLGQVEAAVKDHQRTAAGLQRGQFLDGDQGLVGGGVGCHGCGTPKASAGGGAPAAKGPIHYATAPGGPSPSAA